MESGKSTKSTGGRKGVDERKKSVTKSVKVGLQFPVDRIDRFLKKDAPVYLDAVLEYLVAEGEGGDGDGDRLKRLEEGYWWWPKGVLLIFLLLVVG